MSAKEKWLNVKEHFLSMNDVQKQGESLKTQRKMFAMFNKHGNYVIKLPQVRVSELLDSGKGKPYDPGNGKIMKEWIIIPEEYSDEWIELAREAKQYAKSLAK